MKRADVSGMEIVVSLGIPGAVILLNLLWIFISGSAQCGGLREWWHTSAAELEAQHNARKGR